MPLLYDLFSEEGKKLDLKKYSKYIDSFSTDEFKVTFLNGQPKLGFNHDGDQTYVSLNDDNSLDYKVLKKVKMLIPKRANRK